LRIPDGLPTAFGQRFIKLAENAAAAILTTLQAGWELAKLSPDVHPGAEEIPITERLRDGMRNALEDDLHPWRRKFTVMPGTESRSNPALARPDGRTDIPLFFLEIFIREGDHDPHAIVECKRISGADTTLCREYVVEGIDRFRRGLYGANHAAGFMAGYVISGDSGQAAAGVNRYLVRRERPGEQLSVPGLIDHPEIWRSAHQRAKSGAPIELHHCFLPIDPGTPGRPTSCSGNSQLS
jgi:hypothetical protein